MTTLKYAEAVREALRDALSADERVVVMGQEVGRLGGVFTVTQQLRDEFGPDRVMDTPISEAAVVGWAVGAASEGLRPVVEIMFMDFATLAMDQLVNGAAKLRYMSGGQYRVPLVVRMPYGAGTHHGPQHSQSLEAWFAHVPGLTVMAPATSDDAYAMLRQAIEIDDPVVYLESKALYFSEKGTVRRASPAAGPPTCRVVRPGRHVTVVASGRMVRASVDAAERVEREHGRSCEVIDVRCLAPLDMTAIASSVERTGKLMTVHEAVEFCGWGAEVAAWIAEHRLFHLDGPIVRVGAARSPVPFARTLEDRVVPTPDAIYAELAHLATF